MRTFLRILFFSNFIGSSLLGQSPGNGDCNGSIPITSGYYDLTTYLTPTNNVLNEINPASSCLSLGEVNGMWFEMMILDSGILSFDIIPNDHTDDYDFALYDLTNALCSDIFYIDSLEVRCNYSNSVNNNGTTGANDGPNSQDSPTLTVISGQKFKLYINNFTASNSGFQLNMNSSTCTFDPIIGIENNTIKSQVKIYPNPTVGPINIEINDAIIKEITEIKMVDLMGKIIFQKSSNLSTLLSFDLSNHSAGLYFMQFCSKSKQYSFPLVIQ